jgi:hypothetical protein
VGIMAIPHLLTLGLNLAQVLLVRSTANTAGVAVGHAPSIQGASAGGGFLAFGLLGGLVGVVVYLFAYLFSQGGTIYAVSDLYLGRPTTIGASLQRMWGRLLNLFGVSVLSGLAILAATLFLIIPGIYVACRLITCLPAALLEDLGPRESLSRSFALTKANAGRAFGIYVIYIVMLYAIIMVFTFPSLFLTATLAKDPSMAWISLALVQVGTFVAGTLVGPFLLIATSVFYYDLRVRKEAFDLQMMMNPSGSVAPTVSTAPSLLS